MKKIYISKAKSQIARHNTIRDINKQIVLNYVRVRAPISRAQIARETSLQRSTISSIVDDLQRDGLIEETGTGDSTGGRKPTLLKLKSGTPVAIGVDVTPTETTISLTDLSGQMLEQERFPTSSDVEYMNAQILSKIGSFVDAHPGTSLEVGLSIPGIADSAGGKILYVPYFRWTDWDIGDQIEEKFGLPVVIDNDANAVALAELWFGGRQIRAIRNFIFVLVAEGIGTGIVIDGQLYRGESGAAGEFGHMYVEGNATTACSCGRFDCWEAHASEKAIVNRYRQTVGNSDGVIDMERLIRLAQNGERAAVDVLKESAKYLGIGISNLLIGFSPQAVVIGGKIAGAWDLISDEIQVLSERSVRHELSRAIIVPSSLGDEPTILGSISLVLAGKFASAS
ncbi:MAG: ROK family transcriptional regulator [Acidobacteriota bacterium]